MSVKPISFQEAQELKISTLPDGVIKAFNDLIVHNLNVKSGASSGTSKVTRNEALALLRSLFPDTNMATLEEWLNVENFYRDQGWTVDYFTPENDQSFESFYLFTGSRLHSRMRKGL